MWMTIWQISVQMGEKKEIKSTGNFRNIYINQGKSPYVIIRDKSVTVRTNSAWVIIQDT